MIILLVWFVIYLCRPVEAAARICGLASPATPT
jgi:hypothetical protein